MHKIVVDEGVHFAVNDCAGQKNEFVFVQVGYNIYKIFQVGLYNRFIDEEYHQGDIFPFEWFCEQHEFTKETK